MKFLFIRKENSGGTQRKIPDKPWWEAQMLTSAERAFGTGRAEEGKVTMDLEIQKSHLPEG